MSTKKVKGLTVERDHANSYKVSRGDMVMGRISFYDDCASMMVKQDEAPYWVKIYDIDLNTLLGAHIDNLKLAFDKADTKAYLQGVTESYIEMRGSSDFYTEFLQKIKDADTTEQLEMLCITVDDWIDH